MLPFTWPETEPRRPRHSVAFTPKSSESSSIWDPLRPRARRNHWLAAGNGEELSDDTRVALLLAAVYSTSPIQRVFRDVHVATQHAMVARRTFEPLGRYGFGLPTVLTTL